MSMKEEYDRETEILYERWSEKENEPRAKKILEELRERKIPKITKCLLCSQTFENTKQFMYHWEGNHKKLYGEFPQFLSKYEKYIQQVNTKIDSELQEKMNKELEREYFHRAIITPQKTRDDLAMKFTIPLIRKEKEDLEHSMDMGVCPICNLTEPILDSENQVTSETIEEHMKKHHWQEWNRYVELYQASKGNLQALSDPEELARTMNSKEDADAFLIKSTTNYKREREQLRKSDRPNKTLLTLFGKETLQELSKKERKGKLKRKTQVPNSTDQEE